jgi:hypothetical protein
MTEDPANLINYSQATQRLIRRAALIATAAHPRQASYVC